MSLWIIWLTVICLFVIVYFMTSSQVSLYFIVSAILSLILSFVSDNFFIQLLIFILLGLLLMIFINRSKKPKEFKNNSTSLPEWITKDNNDEDHKETKRKSKKVKLPKLKEDKNESKS